MKNLLKTLVLVVMTAMVLFTLASCEGALELLDKIPLIDVQDPNAQTTIDPEEQTTPEEHKHVIVIDEAVAPTCTEAGKTEGQHCSECNEVIVAQEEIPALGHKHEAVVTAPTCTKQGYTTYTCTCGDTYKEDYVDALGHEIGAWQVSVAPTCTEAGECIRKCVRCEYADKKIVNALGHTEVVDAAVAPTCTATGLTEGSHCSVCNDVLVEQKVVEALGHTEVAIPAVKATCTEPGLTAGVKCSVCNDILVAQEEITALGHDEVAHEAKAPTCTEKGNKAYVTCTRCDYTTFEEIGALGHNEVAHEAKEPTCTEDGHQAYVTCTRCDYTTFKTVAAPGHDVVAHEAKAPTCTEKGNKAYVTCTRCDYTTFEEIGALGHNEVAHEAKDPTCTEKGNKAYVTCTRCDYTTFEEIGALGHNEVIIPGKAANCTEAGLTDGKKCSACNATLEEQKEIPANGHDERILAAEAATCAREGLTEGKYCYECGETIVKQTVVPVLPHTYDDDTDLVCNICSFERACLHAETVVVPGSKATCTESGLTDGKKCKICGDTVVAQETIPATGHQNQVKIPAVAPTCTTEGATEGLKCYTCDAIIVRPTVIPAKNHTEKTLAAVAATCTKTGLTEGKQCSECGEILVAQETVPMLDHTYAETWTKDGSSHWHACTKCGDRVDVSEHVYTTEVENSRVNATCETDGKYTLACVCGAHKDVALPATGHTESEWIIDTAATCTANGSQHIECTVCEKILKTETIEKLGHDEVEHEGKDATCTDKGYKAYVTCTRCDYTTYEETAALGHDEVKHEAKAPTCTQKGNEAYVTCTRCNYTTFKEIDVIPHTDEAIPAKKATCTETGLTAGVKCSECGAIIVEQKVVPTIDHTEEDIPAVEATCTKVGSTAGKKCSVCGEITVKPEEVAMADHNYVDGKCSECEAEDPDHYFEMTIPEALESADGKKVQVSGTVAEINTPWNDNYGNITVTIVDKDGNKLYIYRMETNVVVGDIITVKGVMGSYNGAPQIAQGSTAEITGHDASYDNIEVPEYSISEALKAEDGTKVKVTGTVIKINTAWSDSYNNITVTIADDEGNQLYVYRLATKVEEGQIITITGNMGTFNGARQMAAGATAEITGTHSCSKYDENNKCLVCGKVNPDAVNPDDPSTPTAEWTLVTELKDGDRVLIGAPAYGKLLSVLKVSASSYYNKGVDYSADNFANVTDDEIFVVTVNADGSYTFTSLTGDVIALADSYSSLNADGAHKSWTLTANGDGTFLVYNTGRNTYLEWYNSKNNWSTYNNANSDLFHISFYVKTGASGDTPVDPECKHTNTKVEGAKDATCVAAGYTGDTVCVDCGVVVTKGEEIPATGKHTFADGKCTVCGEADPDYVAPDAPAAGGSADFDTIEGKGSSSYSNATTADGWVISNSAIQVGGSNVANPAFPVIGSDNTHKAPCLTGKTSVPGKVTSPTLAGGISKLTINYTKMFTDTKLSVTITVTDKATGATYTHVIAVELPKDEKYVVYTDEWVLETPITGDFTIEIVNNCPSDNSSSHKDRITILSIVWEGAESGNEGGDTPVEPECKHTNTKVEGAKDATCAAAGYTGDTVCADCGVVVTKGEEIPATDKHTFVDGKCTVCGEADPDYVAPEVPEYTIPDALKAEDGTEVKVTGTVIKIDTAWSEQYGNITVTIADDEGNQLYVFRLATKVEEGQIVTITGSMGTYGGARQMVAGATAEITGTHSCSKYNDATCTSAATCVVCGKENGEPIDHKYENGVCTMCGIKDGEEIFNDSLAITATGGTLASDSLSISWATDNFDIIVYKDGSSTAIRVTDSDHFRCYQGSKLSIVGKDGQTIKKIVITAASSSYAEVVVTSATNAGYKATQDGSTITIEINDTKVEYTHSAQARITNIEIVYTAAEGGDTPVEPECKHTNTKVEGAIEATCAAAGYTGNTVCVDCGVVVTKGEEIPATGKHIFADGKCSVCGANDPDYVAPEEPDVPGESESVTASKTIAELITEYGWTSSTTKQEFNLDNNVTVKINGGSNTGKAYNGNHIRIYATDSPAGTITITLAEGYELVSIKITAETGTYAFLYVEGSTTDISNQSVNVSGSSVVLTSVKNGSDGKQVRVTGIEVVYN